MWSASSAVNDLVTTVVWCEGYVRPGICLLTGQAKDKTLYVNDITNATSEEFLRALVPDCTKAHIPVDSEGNRRGWALLEFRNGKEADECMKSLKELDIGDHKVVITRAEASDPEEVEKAKELHKNKPLKRKKAAQTSVKDKKRVWNQGPGMLGPHPLMPGQRGGPNRQGRSQGGGYGWQPDYYEGDGYDGGYDNRSSGYQGRYGRNQDNYGGNRGNYGGNQGGNYGGNQGNYGGNQGNYGNQGNDYGYGPDRGYNQGYQNPAVQQMRQKFDKASGDDDNMLDFLQSAIQEIKSKKGGGGGGGGGRQQQYSGDSWQGSGGYSQGGFDGGYGQQQEGFGQNAKRKKDAWSGATDTKSWGGGKSFTGNQKGLGVWNNKGTGNQQSNKGTGYTGMGSTASYSTYGGGYSGNNYEQYDSYSTFSGRY